MAESNFASFPALETFEELVKRGHDIAQRLVQVWQKIHQSTVSKKVEVVVLPAWIARLLQEKEIVNDFGQGNAAVRRPLVVKTDHETSNLACDPKLGLTLHYGTPQASFNMTSSCQMV